jgi:two-component sensor histidine kinase
MEALFRLLPGPQPILVRYGAATLFVLLAFGLRLGVGESTGPYGFILFILPIVASALLFDRGTGLYATVLSAALDSYLLPWTINPHVHVAALVSFLVVSACLVFIAEGLHRALEAAHKAEREKDLLLQEMTHRVKNKFAMMSSIIGMQARSATPDVRTALEDVGARVHVIATVHNYLQVSRHEGLIDMNEYVGGLCRSLAEALGNVRPIRLSVKADRVLLPPDKALSVGVIINELVTNAFKYAFPGERAGHVHVEFTDQRPDLILSVADDGKGCPKDVHSGLGTKLVTVFAGQLGGNAEWHDGVGCKAVVTFPA